MDPSMLEEIVFWNWWVFALVLFIIEVLVAGTFFSLDGNFCRPGRAGAFFHA